MAPATDRAPKRKEDTAIRVTLGRPESLPTLADSGPMLASSTNWKRPGESTPRSRPVSGSRPAKPRDMDRSEQPDSNEESPAQIASREGAPARLAAVPARSRAASRTAPAASADEELRSLLARARKKLETMSTYQVNITRVERVGNQMQPEEDVVLSIRRNPKAVRLEWPKGPSKGREVIYSASLNPRTMYVNMANSALPIPRMSIPIDSPMVLRSSRHPDHRGGFRHDLRGSGEVRRG